MKERKVAMAGAITYWSCGPTNRDALNDRLTSLGLNEMLPNPRTPVAALHDAMKDLYGDPRHLVRHLDANKGCVLVKESRGQDENEYDTLLTCRLMSDDFVASAGLKVTEDGDVPAAVMNKFKAKRRELPGPSVSRMLVNINQTFGGTCLRSAGGVYFVREHQLDRWQRVAKAVEESVQSGASSEVYLIRTVADEQTIRAIRDGLSAEMAREIEALNDNMDGLGVDALTTRLGRADALRAKLESYQTEFGIALEAVNERLDNAKYAAAQAQMRKLSQQAAVA